MAHRLLWKKYKGPGNGKWVEFDCPAPGPDEIKIAVKAAGVNYADILMVNGQYQDAPKPPATPGYEAAGIVIEAGSDSGFKKGDRVVTLTAFNGYADELTVKARLAAVVPDSISFEDAASFPVTGLTAMLALEYQARMKKDDVVLIHSASGGVGQMAIQLCLLNGARPVGIVSRESKKEYLEGRFKGLSVIVDSPEDSYGDRLKEMGLKIDISMNPVGGATVHIDKENLNPLGRIIIFGIARASGRGVFGLLSTVKPMLFSNPITSMKKNIGMFGLNLLNMLGTDQESMVRPALERFLTYFSEGSIQSMVDKTFPMPKAAEAHRLLSERKAVGKLILTNE